MSSTTSDTTTRDTTSDTRTYVVTGAGSGIGKATKEALEAAGHTVVGVDLEGAQVTADLSSPEGRKGLREAVVAAGAARIDGILAIAGVSAENSVPVRVNYFGAIATLEQLRPLLDGSSAPRAAAVSSFAAISLCDDELLDLLRAGEEEAAIARADAVAAAGQGQLIYASTKRALAEWIRQRSIEDAWAGSGVALNAVAPGVILTPLTAGMLSTQDGRRAINEMVPMPLNGQAEPSVVAEVLVWLTGTQNTHITGQVIFVDGGAEASVRGPRIFS